MRVHFDRVQRLTEKHAEHRLNDPCEEARLAPFKRSDPGHRDHRPFGEVRCDVYLLRGPGSGPTGKNASRPGFDRTLPARPFRAGGSGAEGASAVTSTPDVDILPEGRSPGADLAPVAIQARARPPRRGDRAVPAPGRFAAAVRHDITGRSVLRTRRSDHRARNDARVSAGHGKDSITDVITLLDGKHQRVISTCRGRGPVFRAPAPSILRFASTLNEHVCCLFPGDGLDGDEPKL